MLQTAETAMGEQHTIIQRMRELAVQAASDTLTAEDRNNIQTEINSLIREIDRLGRATEFNTLRLLDAYNVNPITLQIGARDGQIIGITLLVANSSSAGYAISGLAVTSHAAASLAIASLDNALSIISTERARLGSLENRLEFAIANLNSAHEKITSAESRIRDADIALETLNMTRQQILQQAGVAAQAQANLIPQALLALLG
jgi:flagellin